MINPVVSAVIVRSQTIVPESSGTTKTQSVALSVFDDQEVVLRSPVKEGFFDKVLRYFRNNFCSENWCLYRDVKHNLSAIQTELKRQSEITFEIQDLKEDSYLKVTCENDPKKAVTSYTTAFQKIIKNLPENRQKVLRGIIREIDESLRSKVLHLKGVHSESIKGYFTDVQTQVNALAKPNPNLDAISNALLTIQTEAKKLPGYQNSSLEQEIAAAYARIEVQKCTSCIDVLACITRERAKLTPEVIASFDNSVKPIYVKALAEYKKSAAESIKNCSDLPAEQQKLAQEFIALAAKHNESEFGEKVIPNTKEVFTDLANRIQAKSYSTAIQALRTLQASIPTLSPEKLGQELATIENLLQEYQTEQSSVDMMTKGASENDALKLFIGGLQNHNADYIAKLKEVQNALNSAIAHLPAASKENVHKAKAQALQDAHRKKSKATLGGREYTFEQLTTSAYKALASVFGWATGTKEYIHTACAIDSAAIKTIGATGAFALYAGAGYLLKDLSPFLAVMVAGCGLVLSHGVSLGQREYSREHPQDSYRPILSGVLIMAAYAYFGPELAKSLSGATPTTIQQAEQEFSNNLNTLKSAVETTKEHVAETGKTLELLQKEAVGFNQTVTATQQNVAQFSKHVDSATSHVEAFSKVAAECEPHVRAVGESVQQLRLDVDDLQKTLGNITTTELDTCPNLQGAVEPILEHAAQLTERVEVIAQDNIQLKSALSNVITDRASLQADITGLQVNNAALTSQVGNLQQHVTNLQGNLTVVTHDLEVCESSLGNVSKSHDTYQATLNTSRSFWRVVGDVAVGGSMVAGGAIAAITGIGTAPGVLASAAGVTKILGQW